MGGKELEQCMKLHQEIEELIQKQRKVMSSTFREIQDSKRPLLDETRDSDLSRYTILEGRYDAQKILAGQLESVRKSLPLHNIYFKLARYWERKHDMARAIAVDQVAEKQGISPEEARRQIDRLKRR